LETKIYFAADMMLLPVGV